MKEDQLSAGTLLGVAMPLLAQMIVEGRSAELSGHEFKDADKDRYRLDAPHVPLVLLSPLCQA